MWGLFCPNIFIGCENTYLLSGGINEFAGSYSSYIEGQIPEGIIATSPLKSSDRSPTGKASGTLLTEKNLKAHRGSRQTPRDDRSEVASSTLSVAESVISRATARKGRF